ncbi:MAG: glucose 1-dehydrogenase [Proteobacteria bacterium]|nr:glucose 1-dehydrogenase [Pseudomonadota bacterium]
MGDALAGKSILITGAASGIGRAAAELFAANGARLTLADMDADGGEAVAKALGARFIKADVTQSEQVRAAVALAVEAYGRLDGAFNNAGVSRYGAPLALGEEAEFDRVMAINVKGVWLCLKHEIAQMLGQSPHGGAIVNTASVAGLYGAPMMEAYAASKHAVVGLTKTAALEYAKLGVRVNSVCPGVIRTPMMDQATQGDSDAEKRIAKAHPIGRVGEPEEIAAAAMWLLSDAASFVTGHQLVVDGGMTAI